MKILILIAMLMANGMQFNRKTIQCDSKEQVIYEIKKCNDEIDDQYEFEYEYEVYEVDLKDKTVKEIKSMKFEFDLEND